MSRDEYKSKVMEITPSRLHPLLKGVYRTVFPENKSIKTAGHMESVPENLPDKHIRNVVVHPSREEMLTTIPKEGKVAELGVDEGDFSDQIISITEPEKLFLVDEWGTERYGEEKMRKVKKRFDDHTEVSIVRERSEVALNNFEDGFFDLVYIDTTHSYEQTSVELDISQRKVKEDGIIAGHDYCVGNVSRGVPYGVISAVHEFCVRENWQISHLSLETHGYRSFALEKIET